MNKEALNQFLSEIGRRKNKKPENDEKRKEQAKINILKANEARRKKKQPVLDDTNNENENPFSDGPKDILAQREIPKVKKYDELKNEIQEMKSMFNSYLEGKKRKQEVKHEEKKQEAMVKNVVLTHLPNMLSQYKAHDVGHDARASSILKLSKQLEDNKMNILSKIIK